jgi:hypothetical protein
MALQDGYVFFFMLGGAQGAKTGRALTKWMEEMGMSNDFLSAFVWEELDIALAPQELINRISAPIEAFFKTLTKKEVLDAAIGRKHFSLPAFQHGGSGKRSSPGGKSILDPDRTPRTGNSAFLPKTIREIV